MKVLVPPLEQIDAAFLDWSEGDRRIQDIAGRLVGRMPRHLCNVVHMGMRLHNNVRHAGCFCTGEIVQGGPVVGGGPQLRAVYLLEVENGADFISIANFVRRHLEAEGQLVMFL